MATIDGVSGGSASSAAVLQRPQGPGQGNGPRANDNDQDRDQSRSTVVRGQSSDSDQSSPAFRIDLRQQTGATQAGANRAGEGGGSTVVRSGDDTGTAQANEQARGSQANAAAAERQATQAQANQAIQNQASQTQAANNRQVGRTVNLTV